MKRSSNASHSTWLLLAMVLATSLAVPLAARAGEMIKPEDVPPELKVLENTTPLLPIPDAKDVHLTADEWTKVQAGEIAVQIVDYSKEDRMARGIGYMKNNPVAVFDIATDSVLAVHNFKEITGVSILKTWPTGKIFYMTINPFLWLTYHFTSIAEYADPPTGQTFHQIVGEFQRNEGVHSYLWDPERKQTLGVFQFAFALKGVMSIVPESWLLSMAKSRLPEAIRTMDSLATTTLAADPARAQRVAERWAEVEPRLESGELPGRVWRGPPKESD